MCETPNTSIPDALETSGQCRLERRRFLQWLTAPAVLALLPDPVWAASVRIAAARLWPSNEYTRLTLEAVEPFKHQVRILHHPERIVIDLENLSFSPELQKLAERANVMRDRYLRSIRFGSDRSNLRIVLDLNEASHPQIFTLKPIGNYHHRLVIDLYPNVPYDPLLAMVEQEALKAHVEPPARSTITKTVTQTSKKIISPTDLPDALPNDRDELLSLLPNDIWNDKPTKALSPSGPGKAAVIPPKNSLPAKALVQEKIRITEEKKISSFSSNPGLHRNSGVLTIAIDPGHGGEDPGAIGQQQTYEKHVTLAIGRKLRAALEHYPHIRTMMTRDDDYFVPLHQRVQKARRVKADLFVSIHADAFTNPSVKGSSVFMLSEHGASSAAARWLAQKENASDSIGGVQPSRLQDATVARLLLDMSQTATMNDSLKLAQAVLKEMGEVNSLHTSRVEQAGFAVLKAPDIPSILVETAFISNPEEEQKLRSESHQHKVAQAITEGIQNYASKHPRLAALMRQGDLS